MQKIDMRVSLVNCGALSK